MTPISSTNHPAFKRRAALAGIAGLALVAAAALVPAARSEAASVVPAPAVDQMAAPGVTSETAVLAGGCFWGVQGVFQHLNGVIGAVSGYVGGASDTANYDAVTSGRTGHAEAVRVTYDPAKISYGRLLQIYFSVAHDPTQMNRQGPDSGTQYRSAVFPGNAEQAKVARAYIEQLTRANTYGKPLATTVEPMKAFFPAEAYHQDYMTLHPRQPYIVAHDLPKLADLKRLFPEQFRAQPVLVGTGVAAR